MANTYAASAHAWIHCGQVAIAAYEEQCADQQHHGDGDLSNDHQALDGEAFTVAGNPPLAGLECRKVVGAGTGEGGEGPEADAGGGGHDGGEEQSPPVSSDGEM